MTVIVKQDAFQPKEQMILSAIQRSVKPDSIEIETDLALIAVVGRSMRAVAGISAKIFTSLANANVNVKMLDQGSSELNVIIGVNNKDFEAAIKAIYNAFVK